MSGYSSPLRLRQMGTPPAPEAGSQQVYAKTDGRLYTEDSTGAELLVAPIHVGPATPTFEAGQRYLWVQTGLGATGADVTFWVEDGL